VIICEIIVYWLVIVQNKNLPSYFARHWLRTPWGWHSSVETCSRNVIICEIIVHLLVIVQNKNLPSYFARHWLRTPWGWHSSVETCSRNVIICEIIVHWLVIVQNTRRWSFENYARYKSTAFVNHINFVCIATTNTIAITPITTTNNITKKIIIIYLRYEVTAWCPNTQSALFVCSFWRDSPQWATASSFKRIIPLWHATVGRTPLDKRSAWRTDLYLTTHNTHNRQTSMPPVGFETTNSERERSQTYALDRVATGIG